MQCSSVWISASMCTGGGLLTTFTTDGFRLTTNWVWVQTGRPSRFWFVVDGHTLGVDYTHVNSQIYYSLLWISVAI